MSNGVVIIDAKKLREFTSQLKQFNSELSNSSTRLTAQFRQLGETWRDPAYAKFAQEFESIMRNLHRFKQISDETIPFLLRKAEKAEAVHQ